MPIATQKADPIQFRDLRASSVAMPKKSKNNVKLTPKVIFFMVTFLCKWRPPRCHPYRSQSWSRVMVDRHTHPLAGFRLRDRNAAIMYDNHSSNGTHFTEVLCGKHWNADAPVACRSVRNEGIPVNGYASQNVVRIVEQTERALENRCSKQL